MTVLLNLIKINFFSKWLIDVDNSFKNVNKIMASGA